MFKINKNVNRLIGTFTIAALLLTNVCTVFAGELDDLDIPPYKPADVVRKDVVVWANPTGIPAQFASNVIRTYPDGKMKAFVMTFDDGGQSGYTLSDYHLILPALRANGLKAAFFCNQPQGLVTSGITVGYVDPNASPRVSINTGRMDSQQYKDVMGAMYQGMEIGNHTRDHVTYENQSKDNLRIQVGGCKNTLENVFGKEVAGYGLAGGGSTADPVLPSANWRTEYCKYIGIRYIRYGNIKTPAYADSPATLCMDVPTNFYQWQPSIWFADDITLKSGTTTYSRVDILNYLINNDSGNTLKVLFTVAHGWNEADGSDKSKPNAVYNGLVSALQLAGQHLDILWNPVPIDYVDYINATWNMKFTAGQNGDIKIYNPGGAVTVWQKVYGQLVSVAPGKIVTVNSNGVVTNTSQGETVTNNKPGGFRSGEEFTGFTSSSQNPVTNTVSVKGFLTSSYAGFPVNLMMVPSNTDVTKLTDSDVKYMSQASIDPLGQYSFTFQTDGLEFDGNSQCSNYKLLLNVAGKDVTQSVTKATISSSPIRANVSIEVDDTAASAVSKIDNMSNTTGQSYILILAFYDANEKLIGTKLSDTKAIQNGLVGFRISDVVPKGTTNIKAYMWNNTERVIPLGKPSIARYTAP